MDKFVILTCEQGIPLQQIAQKILDYYNVGQCLILEEAYEDGELNTLCENIAEGNFLPQGHFDITLLLIIPIIKIAVSLVARLDNLQHECFVLHFTGSAYWRFRWVIEQEDATLLSFYMNEQNRLLPEMMKERADVSIDIDKSYQPADKLQLLSLQDIQRALGRLQILSSKA